MKIEKSKYEGYIWLSDADEPRIVNGEFELDRADCENPFVVEGMLYDSGRSLSMSIRYVDGRYLVARHEVGESEVRNSETYKGKRMPNLRMTQLWREEKDENCIGMTVQRPGAKVFVGFEK